VWGDVLKLIQTITGSRWFHPLLLLLWVAVGTGLRLIHLTAKAPWVDEFATIVFSLGHSFSPVPLDQAIGVDALLQPIQADSTTGIGDVIDHLLTQSNHPPLYFVLAHLWMRLFPTDDGLVSLWAARSLPALFGILSIPALFGLSLLAFRSRLVAQMAAAMMAVSPFGIFLAQEARHYTLAILFVIASMGCLIVAVQSIYRRTPLPVWVGLTWIVINTLGIATHYFFALTLCAEGLVLVAVAWRDRKRGRVEERKEEMRAGESKDTLISSTTHSASENYPHHPITLSPPLAAQTLTKANPPNISKSWWRISWVAAGTVIGSAVWLPILQSNYDNELTHWIYDGDPLKSWLEPIGRVLAWLITMLMALPMEFTTLPLPVVIASGLVTVIFLLWVLPILWYGLQLKHFQPDVRLNVQVLGGFVIGALALFFGISYTSGADLTLAPRYHFVYFPVAISLLGAALATSWDTLTPEAKMEPSTKLRSITVDWKAGGVGEAEEAGGEKVNSLNAIQYNSARPLLCAIRFPRKGGKKAVMLIWLMGVLGGLTVTWNLGYLQSIRPDFLVDVIQKTSNSPVLIAATHQHHGHTGRMMGLAWQFKHLERSDIDTPSTQPITSPQFLLAHTESNPQSRDPSITLQETVAKLPRPLDVWLVNFHAGVDLAQQNCFAVSQRLPKLDSYWYRLYRCPMPQGAVSKTS
jgi:uncharacterized membrane protein